MISMTRSAAIAPGKTREALTFAHAIAKMIHETYGVKLELQMPIGGNPNRIAWHARYESIADWDALGTKLIGDADYAAAVAANSATFIAGSVHDDIWRSI